MGRARCRPAGCCPACSGRQLAEPLLAGIVVLRCRACDRLTCTTRPGAGERLRGWVVAWMASYVPGAPGDAEFAVHTLNA